mmetsp:Transcript_6353/g.4797  ORF Transcript_6353/g.4797 Transcript_6353/m.4797 type:complete len:170 (-) Transcript_6353:479-988(-)|eukprot:CAMPEP_0202970316 /NCGR_PEP_ID=MMETSP1396-20130829/16274_1 /ASSEMBLY_ACC=CAM_ASM_000872 /TAXON_ID= /ORGANISM="Pseudokeronopsis sp., Strain Brazil" /LENGTH=169 /DNA_ID=CAMNT_0049698727 /DNA_START=2156 /DNA_END=2665 /DNA_ORIENTATION=+
MVHSYFKHSTNAHALVAFERDIWAIAYYYTSRSCLYTGHEVNRTSKSGSRAAFLKRYLYPGQRCLVFAGGELFGECLKLNGTMQLPISSLNEYHTEEYELGLNPVFSYHLGREELEQICLESDDPNVKALLNIPSFFLNEEEKGADGIWEDSYEEPLQKHPLAFAGATL